MCENVFPSFSQAQLSGGALAASPYASGFAPACDTFREALMLKSPEDYYLVFGLPIGPVNWMAGVSVCFAMRPTCGSNTGEHHLTPSLGLWAHICISLCIMVCVKGVCLILFSSK